ncbi:MAG: hypothetical protein FIB08_09960 [Candidatus Methanoperedens sp.]|nr:hypothetical protein [Candidatus Methanoperedens sp.]
MIVRLMGEGQFEVEKECLDEVNKIDNNIVKIVNKGDEKAFRTEIKKMTECVRRQGKKVPVEVLKPSDVIIPPVDLTLEEAKKIFKDEGLIPD